MNRVIDHVQGHLAEPLNLERLAAIACFSPFHFHRLFRAWTGETLQAFVHRLRLERAAQMLVCDTVRSISDVALECGFSSSSAFARAFKAAFGTPASEWRKRKMCQTNRNPGKVAEPAAMGFSNLPGTVARNKEIAMKVPFEVKVRHLPTRTIAYIRHIGPYKGDAALFRRLFTRLFAWAVSRGEMAPEPIYFSLMQDNPNLTPAAKQRLEVALVVLGGTVPSGEVGVRTLPGGLFATARVRVSLQEYAAQWDALVGDWLPESGYQPDHRPAMEIYLNNPDNDPEGKYDIEMCLPIRAF